MVLHEPQVDSWKNHAQIKFRCAVEVSLSGTASPAWGVVAATADTSVDENDQLVTLTNIQVAAVRFPGTPDADAAALSAVVTSLLPSRPSLQVALSRVLAYMHNSPPPPPVAVSLQPPPIFYSSTPAILVNYIGQPQFRPVDGTSLMFAVNTNWTILMDVASSTYYLMLGKSWLSAPDPMNGPWSVATQLPASFSALPAGDQWKDVIAANPPQPLASAPTVFTRSASTPHSEARRCISGSSCSLWRMTMNCTSISGERMPSAFLRSASMRTTGSLLRRDRPRSPLAA